VKRPADRRPPIRIAVTSRAKGYTTVLLLETKDSARMSQHKMLEAAREGMGGATIPGVDQIWYVDAEGYVAIDLTSALVNGHDELE
jgi:hypothetical protein